MNTREQRVADRRELHYVRLHAAASPHEFSGYLRRRDQANPHESC